MVVSAERALLLITAVGATRFIDQKPMGGEMASDMFGSGGG